MNRLLGRTAAGRIVGAVGLFNNELDNYSAMQMRTPGGKRRDLTAPVRAQ